VHDHCILGCLLLGCALAVIARTASAAPSGVDPSTLHPSPPPGATCNATGRYVLCKTVLDAGVQAKPATDRGLPCATSYWTTTDVQHGLRFYARLCSCDGEPRRPVANRAS
jgi:hypothetical protein